MDLPSGNFFEVTINTSKLYSFVDQISKQMAIQKKTCQQISKNFNQFSTRIQNALNKQKSQNDLQLQKLRKSYIQQCNFLRLLSKDIDKKACQKMDDLQRILMMLNQKVKQNKQNLEQDINLKISLFEKKLNSNDQILGIQAKIQKQINKIKQDLDHFSIKLIKIQRNLNEQSKKNQKLSKQIIFTEEQYKQLKSNHSIRQTYQSKSNIDNSDLQRLINKVEQIQGSLNKQTKFHEMRKSIQTNGNIIKFNGQKNKNIKNKSSFYYSSQQSVEQTFRQNLQQSILKKLQNIQQLSSIKIQKIQKQLNKLNNKVQINNQFVGILSRKLQKQKVKINQMNDIFRKMQQKRLDEKAIETLKNNLKKLAKDVQQALQTKVNKQYYQKQKAKLTDKIYNLNDIVQEKSQKSDLKKGLSFLQQKIKQIIIILAQQRMTLQDGAIKKQPFKCLSCDKDLQIQKNQNNIPKTGKQNTSRCLTNQLKKRIRVVNNNTNQCNYINTADD